MSTSRIVINPTDLTSNIWVSRAYPYLCKIKEYPEFNRAPDQDHFEVRSELRNRVCEVCKVTILYYTELEEITTQELPPPGFAAFRQIASSPYQCLPNQL